MKLLHSCSNCVYVNNSKDEKEFWCNMLEKDVLWCATCKHH